MKYRSYNSELLIATTLMCDVFNDVIIDRRKHGLKRDYSQAITLADIVQQKIEVPCIIGDRSPILKSLENQPGRYKLPLIIIQMKDLKTDTARMCDLHADVFYQQDSAFSELDITDSKYRPQELSKKRGQPITIDYDVTFITKYREDLDQIVSNFAVHFRPDIYLKWYHPRITDRHNRKCTLTSQLLWSHSVNFDSSVDYNPQNVFVYKGTTSFTFKTWLFYGMISTDNAIDPNLESVIKYVKLFPNRSDEDRDDGMNRSDSHDDDDTWSFGNVENKDEGTLGFHSVDDKQDFIGNDPIRMVSGDYAVNNIFNQDYAPISGDELFSNIKTNTLVSDFFSTYDKLNTNNFDKYQQYIMIDTQNIKKQGNSLVKNTFYKGSFPQSSFMEDSPSGDFMFRKFFKTQINNYGQEKRSEFGESFINQSPMNVEYDVNSKDFVIWAKYDSNEYSYYLKSKFNSSTGYFQEFEIKSKPFRTFNDYIAYSFHKEYDNELNNIEENNVSNSHNMYAINDQFKPYATMLHIDDYEVKNELITLRNYIKSHWKSFNLMEKSEGIYSIEIEDTKAGKIAKDKKIYDLLFRSVRLIGQTYLDGYNYQILINKYIYLIMKTNISNEEDCDIYDFGILFPLKYKAFKALIYEITIPESRELLGLNFYLGF